MAEYIRAIENNSIEIKLSANLDLQTWDGWQALGDRQAYSLPLFPYVCTD